MYRTATSSINSFYKFSSLWNFEFLRTGRFYFDIYYSRAFCCLSVCVCVNVNGRYHWHVLGTWNGQPPKRKKKKSCCVKSDSRDTHTLQWARGCWLLLAPKETQEEEVSTSTEIALFFSYPLVVCLFTLSAGEKKKKMFHLSEFQFEDIFHFLMILLLLFLFLRRMETARTALLQVFRGAAFVGAGGRSL